MIPNIVINVYCNGCNKICSSNINPKPIKEAEEYIIKWSKNPYCIECIQKRMGYDNRT